MSSGSTAGHNASVDGEITTVGEARIPITDEGLLRGDGVFEVARLYAGRPFGLDSHLARLRRSAQRLRLEVDHQVLACEITALLAAAGAIDAVLRIVCTRGGRRLLMTEPLPDQPGAVRLASVEYVPTRVLDQVKSLSYAANMLATRLAKERGADDALLVTPHGHVLEAPTAAFFWVADGRLLTPPISERILESITRATVMELCEVQEAVCTLSDLEGAQEAFIASAVREVMPVSAIDDRAFEMGAVTRATKETLTAHVRAHAAEFTGV